MSHLDNIRENLEHAHKRERAAVPHGVDLAISWIKEAPLSISRGLTFDLVVYLEKRKQERWG